MIAASIRGTIHGYRRSFYKQYSYELNPQCFGEEAEIVGYRVWFILEREQWLHLYEVPGFLYSLYLLATDEC